MHKFNPIRIAYIRDNIIKTFKLKDKNKPLEKIKILDIGCGGGLLSEPMCRMGAQMTGIDASEKNINIAKLHAKKDDLSIWSQFYETRYDYLRIAKAMLNDWENDTCAGQYLKTIHERRIPLRYRAEKEEISNKKRIKKTS